MILSENKASAERKLVVVLTFWGLSVSIDRSSQIPASRVVPA